MHRSTPPVTSLPYQISTSNDCTKIHKSPIAFRGTDFLSSAANWTRHKLFSNDGAFPISPPAAIYNSPPVKTYANGTVSPPGSPQSSLLRTEMGPDGHVLTLYPTCVQVWKYTGGILNFVGSTHSVNGSIADATMISAGSNNGTLVLQVFRSRMTHLEIHELSRNPSLVNTLILPPASSGPGPYQIFTGNGTSPYLVVVTATGLVTLFSSNRQPLALSGLEVAMAPDGSALLDLQGRWLALVPTLSSNSLSANADGTTGGGRRATVRRAGGVTNAATVPTAHTPVNLPPSGPLYERIVDSLSTTAITSLKSLSEAGYSGLKYYLSKDGSGNDQLYSSSSSSSPPHAGGGGALNGVGPIPGSGNTSSSSSSLRLLGKLLFSDQSSTNVIQIIDIPTETSICCFSPLEGVSYVSLSPYDATLAAVSTKGDHIYTYDLSFVPREVTVTGRYARGKVPARIKRIAWDNRGGFGLVTHDRGSLHWFDKRLSFDITSNRVWKLSGWGIEDIVFINNFSEGRKNNRLGSTGSEGSVAGNRERESQLMLLRQKQIMIADPASGNAVWKYDLPQVSISDPYKVDALEHDGYSDEDVGGPEADGNYDFEVNQDGEDTPEFSDNDNRNSNGDNYDDDGNNDNENSKINSNDNDDHRNNGHQLMKSVDPLSFFELEACQPYPYIHEDRRVTISTTDFWEETPRNNCEYPMMVLFGVDIATTVIDFGKPEGKAKFTPPEHRSDNDDEEFDEHISNGDEIRRAMESLVLSKGGNNDLEQDVSFQEKKGHSNDLFVGNNDDHPKNGDPEYLEGYEDGAGTGTGDDDNDDPRDLLTSVVPEHDNNITDENNGD